MRAMPEGFQQQLVITVTDEMTVQFAELGPVHPVYATYWLARHFEEAGRKLILPFLEEGEEGIGTQLEVFHTASALPGMRVTVTATFTRQGGRRIHADLFAVNELGDAVGHGTTTQVVTAGTRLQDGFAELRRRWEAAQG